MILEKLAGGPPQLPNSTAERLDLGFGASTVSPLAGGPGVAEEKGWQRQEFAQTKREQTFTGNQKIC